MLISDAAVGAGSNVSSSSAATDARPRVIIETDAGGDPDDEQSLVRFLLYTSDLDVVGIIANRPKAREGENLNSVRTGLGIVQHMVRAYGDCHPMLIQHDPRYPTMHALLERTVAGYDDVDDGVQLVIRAVDADDPRPLWFCNWGTDKESGVSCLNRALERVRAERGAEAHAQFKQRIRLSSDDQFGAHLASIEPPFPIWVDTFRPPVDGKRWYHRFSGITAKAGGFDIERDVRTRHGPLGKLYPLNTTHPQKEGDTMSFLYLVPTGMNDPDHPEWGSWAGRYALNPAFPGRRYYHATAVDRWNGTAHRDNTLIRWAADLQNDFRARMDWCVKPRAEANHPPVVKLDGSMRRRAAPREKVMLDVSQSTDPDGNELKFEWFIYSEVSRNQGDAALSETTKAQTTLEAPAGPAEIHALAIVRDTGEPPLTRYARVVIDVGP